MRYYELYESSAVDEYGYMAKEMELDASDNMVVRHLMDSAVKVKNDCQIYLGQIDPGKDILYRGIRDKALAGTGKGMTDKFIKKDVRLDGRNPKDTDQKAHEYINDYFVKHYGAPFRNGMFATGRESESFKYGTSFQIFPIGDFEFLWSDSVKDLWVQSRPLRIALGDASRGDNPEHWRDERVKKELKMFTDSILGSYTTSNLSGGIKSETEVMMRPASYYGVSFDNYTREYLDVPNQTWPLTELSKISDRMFALFYGILRA